MARVNASLVYPQKGTSLFIRRNPEKTSEWQVVDGKWLFTDGKRSGFDVEKVLETGIAQGKLARLMADKLHGIREAAKVAAAG